MNRARWMGALALTAALATACGEDTTVNPPPLPPQISHGPHWVKMVDRSGRQVGLPSNDVWDVLVTTAGKVWMGTSGGIAVFPDPSTTVRETAFDQNQGLTNPKVRRLVEMDGKIFAATWGGGVSVYDLAGGTWSSIREADGLSSDLVNEIEVDGDTLWFVTQAGADVYVPGTGAFADHYDQDRGVLTALLSDVAIANTPRGRELLFVPKVEFQLQPDEVDQFGATLLRGATRIPMTLVNSGIPELNLHRAFYDPDDDVYYIGTATSGIAVLDMAASRWTTITTTDGLPSNEVYTVTKVAGVLWAATQGGIAWRRPNGRWQGYSRSGGLMEDRVRRVYSDNGQRLWVCYIEGGAGRVNPASVN